MSEKRPVDRREFLKSAAVTGAAALVPASAPLAAQSTPAGPAPAGTAPTPARETDPEPIPRCSPDRAAGRRLHGRRHQVARLRVHRLQSRLELPRHPRIDHQLRRQHGARVHHLLPRRVVGGDGARLLQGRGQADGGAVPRHRRPAARGDGDLQRLLRPRAGLHPRRQLARRDACGGPASSGRTACRTRRRWSATSSSGTTRRSRCRTSPSRRCAPTRSR